MVYMMLFWYGYFGGGGGLCGIVANVVNCDFVGSEFKLQ